MPRMDEQIEGLESSTDPNLDETTEALEQDAQVEDAESSAATDETEESPALSAIRDVVGEDAPEPEAASSAEGEEAGEEAGDQENTGETGEDDYSDVPFHHHPRFQKLLRSEKANRQDAERYRTVQGFMDQQGLSAEEAAELLIIGGLMKTSPAEAFQRIKPALQKLLIAAGEVLPHDLQQRVQNGEVTREAAIEISRLRAQQQSATARHQFEQQRQEAQRQQAHAASIGQAADAWEADRRRKDPNFDAKMELIKERVIVLQHREGVPDTPEGVRAMLDKAYKQVVPPAPKPAPQAQQRPASRTNMSGQVAGNAAQRPLEKMSTLDIIDMHVKSA